MNQIKIGTCIPGQNISSWLPAMVAYGFETVSINYHMSMGDTDLLKLSDEVKKITEGSKTEVSCIGLYCNPLQNSEDRKKLIYCIENAKHFGATTVSTFAGALTGRPAEESLPVYEKVFSELAACAKEHQIKIGIENCPMDGTFDSTTVNIAFHPLIWEQMFQAVDSEFIGLEWEPAHQMLQLIDPIAQLKKWAHKIVHVHGKDATIDWDSIREYGILNARPFVMSRTPGFGDTDWRTVISILRQNNYQGDICIEGYHDPIYGGELEFTGQLHALNYLKWCRGGEYMKNPWDHNE